MRGGFRTGPRQLCCHSPGRASRTRQPAGGGVRPLIHDGRSHQALEARPCGRTGKAPAVQLRRGADGMRCPWGHHPRPPGQLRCNRRRPQWTSRRQRLASPLQWPLEKENATPHTTLIHCGGSPRCPRCKINSRCRASAQAASSLGTRPYKGLPPHGGFVCTTHGTHILCRTAPCALLHACLRIRTSQLTQMASHNASPFRLKLT